MGSTSFSLFYRGTDLIQVSFFQSIPSTEMKGNYVSEVSAYENSKFIPYKV